MSASALLLCSLLEGKTAVRPLWVTNGHRYLPDPFAIRHSPTVDHREWNSLERWASGDRRCNTEKW